MGADSHAYTTVQTEDVELKPQGQVQVQVQEVYGNQWQPQEVAAGKLWATGLCDCFATGGNLCCNVYWCLPCMIGRNHTAAVLGQPDTMDSTVCCGLISADMIGASLAIGLPLATHGACYIPGIDLLGLCVFAGYTWWQRHSIRQRYNISGDACGDCLASFFCLACVTCQHHTELSQNGVNPGSCCCTVGPQGTVAVGQPVVSGVQPAYVGGN